MCYEERHPILLRSGSVCNFSTLIALDIHQRALHHGIETALSHMHSEFWITGGRKSVKDIFKKSVSCKLYQARAKTRLVSPNLPNYRIDSLYSFNVLSRSATRSYTKFAILDITLRFTCG